MLREIWAFDAIIKVDKKENIYTEKAEKTDKENR